MLVSILLIIIGLLLLVGGGELLLRGAVGLATLLKLTPAVIGLTVVAAGTSVPELAVALIGVIRGNVDISVGNVVGSNIFNVTFILGLGALVRPLTISGNTVRLEYPVMALSTLLAVVLCLDGQLGFLEALLMVAIYIGFTAYLVRLVRREVTAIEAMEFGEEVRELGVAPNQRPRVGVCLLQVTSGIALLGLGANATVEGAATLARLLGISDRIIGLTIVAAGTSLPEVVTTLVSSFRGRDDVAVGNVIGSNLFNLLGILGINGLIRPLPVAPEVVASDNWWMLGVALLLFPVIFTGRRINRAEGVLLLAVYGVYLTLLLAR